jgi:NitT/TauT family transport system substrate-binding protein
MKKFSVALIIMVIALGSLSCQGTYSGKVDSITFANLHLQSSALIYVAQDKNFFKNNGLSVTIKEFDTGTATSDALLKGQADLATMAEFLTVGNIFQKQDISIIGTMDKTNTQTLIGLKSRGISKITDLSGKRVGLGERTSSEFYLGRLLDLNGMDISRVTLVDLPPSKLDGSLANNVVDAVVGWAPYSNQIQDHFKSDTVSWEVQLNQPVFGLIIGKTDWVKNNPEIVRRFLKSLNDAVDFLLKNPDQAKAIVCTHLNYDKAYLETIWPQYVFSLSLDQTLVAAMEDEARWMIKNKLTSEKKVPNFTSNIAESGLKTVKPEAVNIIK